MKKREKLSKFHSAFMLLLLVQLSCNSSRETIGNKLVKDDLGREVHLKKEINRIMPLSSSLTEMLYLICDDAQIVGRTHNCNYPVQVLTKPVVNNYPIDYEKLLLLKPDLVVAKDGIISMDEALKIQDMGIPVYFQHYGKVADIFSGLKKLGKILNREERAVKAADSLQALLANIEKSVADLPKPKVLMIISNDKIFVYGKDSYGSDMVSKAGGVNALDTIFNNPFPQITSEYIIHVNPDIIIGAEQVELGGAFFTLYPELKKTDAFKKNRIYTIPEDLISRPGPRVIQGIDSLKKIIHPDAK